MKKRHMMGIGLLAFSVLGMSTLHVQADSTNLALNQPVQFSGIEGGRTTAGAWVYPQFDGKFAVDGDPSTRWSADKVDDQWLTVDLGQVRSIGEITVSFHAEAPAYELLVSTDETHFTPVAATTTGTQGTSVARTFTLAPTQARYVKYHQQKQFLNAANKQYYGSSINELAVYTEAPHADKLTLSPATTAVSVGRTAKLALAADPTNLTPTADQLTWTSSDPTVATVTDGTVKALKAGTATITVALKNTDVQATSRITVAAERQEYDIMRKRWRDRLIDPEADLSDPNIKAYLTSLAQQSDTLWQTLDQSAERTRLWPRVATDTDSADYTTTFTKIKQLTLGYYNPLSQTYHDQAVYTAIISALDFMVDTMHYTGNFMTGNWWDFQIGAAQQLDDTLILLHDDLKAQDYAKLEKFVQPLIAYNPDPNKQLQAIGRFGTATGANLTDISISILASGLLLEDDSRVALVQQNLPKAMGLVTKGDGIYADASYIQHTAIPYTGSYGNEMLKGIARVSSVLVDTPWAIPADQFTHINNLIDKGILQLMVNGRMPSMVSGRSISRAPGTNPETTELETGKETLANLTLIAPATPAALRTKINQAIATWVAQVGDRYNYFKAPRDFAAITGLTTALAAGANASDVASLNIYASMDRVMQKTADYSVGISMYSKRVANFEFMNHENPTGWHTADGMVYLYTHDVTQFDEGYWPTVDPYRLPGTTVDTAPLAAGAGQTTYSPQAWVGGATDGTVASVGMALNKVNQSQNLKAMKSWFLLNGQIVNLGAGITGTTSASIETILDQHKLTAGEHVTVDGAAYTTQKAVTSWANVNAAEPKNNVGYIVAPGNDPVALSQATRSGTYADINSSFPSTQRYTNTYLTLAAMHGTSVTDGTYEYVTVPGATDAQVKALATTPAYTVLRNTARLQAIQTKDTLLANVWTATDQIGDFVSVDNTAAVVIKSLGRNTYTISAAEPRQTNTPINFTFNYPVHLTTDAANFTASGATLTLATDGLAGASRTATFVLDAPADLSALNQAVAAAQALDATAYTPTSFAALATPLADAVALMTADAPAQAAVDTATDKLQAALDALVKAADKARLDQTLKTANARQEAAYTPSTWTSFATARQAAQATQADADATQAAVDHATAALADALTALVPRADTQALAQTIQAIGKLAQGDYTPATWQALQAVLARATAQLADAEASQAMVDATHQALKQALAALAPIPAPTPQRPGDPKPGSHPSPSTPAKAAAPAKAATSAKAPRGNLPQTGAVRTRMPLAGLLTLMSLGLLALARALRRHPL
ncbi:polysaccharide lyase family 8 super-sandwich domain-containing protein [Lacticaseibacillus absianus]|uniref:polysaccharide lyase family 8 super-sandwich domain-containing protein n=1 Tax=Lacticaseibacillus absianus TaxID=2729623 RepID=UPI0015C9AD35|nr:polysaccharide lyase family 8 super-sandwich domain-containing protein [Lacticaseibacillus absianus]